MLLNLHIANLALIDELDIDFGEGLNILTGETGAGKSIIIGSIGIGLGGKFDSSLLRNPEKDGLVELLFSVNEKTAEILSAEGIEPEEGEILISRRLTRGRTVNRINDGTVSVSKLKRVAEMLISLHAQHEQRTLLQPARHLEIVDQWDPAIAPAKEKVREIWKRYSAVKAKLAGMSLDAGDRAKRLDFLEYEIREIEDADVSEGEDTELEALYRKQKSAVKIAEICGRVENLTESDTEPSAAGCISQALSEIQTLTGYDDGDAAAGLLSQLSDIDSLMNDFSRALSDYTADLSFDEEAMSQTESRLDHINSLKMKYGPSIPEIHENLSRMQQERDALTSYDETLAALKKEEAADYQALTEASDALTSLRKTAAARLCEKIAAALRELNFAQVKFHMEFAPAKEYGQNGHDIGTFYISTNVGEPERPLNQVASGGELSRVMLAIKTVSSEEGDTPTLIFDEIDVGISGITAQRVGAMMKKLSTTHQIISITHLPQIACLADTAFVIEKKTDTAENRTSTNIRKLDRAGRIGEIARLLGGDRVTDAVRKSAEEMLAEAETPQA